MQFSFVPEAESDVRLQVSEEGWIAVGSPVGLIPIDIPPIDDVSVALLRSKLPDVGAELVALSCDSEIACAQPLRLDGLSSPHDAMDADAADVMPAVGRPPDAERQLAFSYVVSPVRDAVPRLPPVLVPEPRSLSTNEVSRLVCRMVFGALSDGFVSARSPAWRMPLVRMLTGGTTGADFDRAYGYLLKGFAGNDDRSKARAAAGWARRNLPDAEAADVYRAETRHWLNLGEGALAVDAANRMERARADYAVRACRLRAIAHATSGELEPARREIARFRASRNQTKAERDEFLYLEAWIALQEGDVASARRNLTAIVAESPGGATARKARAVLQSIGEGQ